MAYEIGAAVGILMAGRGLGHADAYAELHRAATGVHGDLRRAAAAVVAEHHARGSDGDGVDG